MHGALADLDRTLRAQVRTVLHTRPYVHRPVGSSRASGRSAPGAGDLVAELTAAGIRAEGIADDPLDQLATHADGSLGAVYSSGRIEHLAVPSQWRLLEVALRALRPGGLFIAETLNPHSVSAMRLLTMGEAGQHPVFPEVALACAD